MRAAAAIITLAAALGPALALAEPLAFKGFPMNGSLNAFKKAAKVTCSPYKGHMLYDTFCVYANRADRTFAAEPVEQIYFMFTAGKFDTVFVTYDFRKLSAINEALSVRYGPTDCMTGSMDSTCVWKLDDGTISSTYGHLAFISAEGDAERARRRNPPAKPNAQADM